MKIKATSGCLFGLFCFASFTLLANQSTEIKKFRDLLILAPAADLPAKAADLVKQAQPQDRQPTTENVVKAALDIKFIAASQIVTAISRSVPEMAPIAAATVGEEHPKEAVLAAQAAASAAPAMAAKIVEAVCHSVPGDYRNIAVTVSKLAPHSSREILDAVATAVPQTKAFIKVSLLSYGNNATSVADILDQANSISQTQSATALTASTQTPSSGITSSGPPPYLPPSETPASSPPDNGGAAPTGDRSHVDP